MAIFILFGLPGSGKTFAGNVFKKYLNFYFYDGDNELPLEMKHAIRNRAKITDAMRDPLFYNLAKKIQKLQSHHTNIVIAQTFIKDKYRKMFLDRIKGANFILIRTNTSIRESRLAKRKNNPLDRKYAEAMVRNFEKPTFLYRTITNDKNGESQVKKQIISILRKFP